MANRRHSTAVADVPRLLDEWDVERNTISPSDVSTGSERKVAWVCSVDTSHRWEATVNNRNRGSGCPYCSGSRLTPERSLAVVAPEVASTWHPTRNGDLRPGGIHAFSQRVVWWKCPVGEEHEWKVSVASRTSGNGCPFCANQRPSATNSLSQVASRLVADWHKELNGMLSPDQVVAGSHKRVWWQCSRAKDHVWRATVRDRVTGSGCPMCANIRPSVTNSLQAAEPELAAQFHPTLNGALTTADIVRTSARAVWWKCDKGPDHEWRATVNSRLAGAGCPFCAGKRASVTNSLATRAPGLVAQWHPTKNGQLTPHDVTYGAKKAVWWKCDKGPDHEWKAAVGTRVAGNGCPFCAGNNVSVTNSLESVAPAVAAQWHPTKNGSLTPRDVVAGSSRRVWWKCDKGPDHEWQTTPNNRVGGGRKCPFCANKLPSVTNSLATLQPCLAAEWHATLNANLTPADVVAGSKRRVWWQCDVERDHYWQATVDQRTRAGTGCPQCFLHPESKQEVLLRYELLHVFGEQVGPRVVLTADRKPLEADVLLPGRGVAVEFDGAYWHQGSEGKDKWKSAALRDEGWLVVRVREQPLCALGPNDLVVPMSAAPKLLANAVVAHIVKLTGPVEGLDAYLASNELANRHEAEKYLRQLRAMNREAERPSGRKWRNR